MEAAAADTAPVSTVDRINFVILLSVALLHTDCPFAETNCVRASAQPQKGERVTRSTVRTK